MTIANEARSAVIGGRLGDKRAIVTGGGKGIGRAIALRLAEEGATVACIDIDEAALDSMKRDSPGLTGKIVPLPGDATRFDSVKSFVSRAVDEMGGLDIVVNNVGLSARGTVETTSEEDWDRVALNPKSVFLVSKFAVPHLRAAGGGAIVSISSCTGVHAETNRVAYGTAKAAIIMMTRLMALDHGADGIRVNCVCPGVTETTLSQGNRRNEAARRGVTLEDVTREIAETYPLGRTGDPKEIADGVLFLVSDEAKWITGVSLSIDGGWSAGEYKRRS